MRFGLADLDELPSLKEFEQLAQAALGADDGIAPTEPEEAGEEQGILASANPEGLEASAKADANAPVAADSDLPAEMASPSAEAVLDSTESALHADESAPVPAEGATAAKSEAATPDDTPPEKKAATSHG